MTETNDVSAAPSTANETTEAAPQSMHERMLATVEKLGNKDSDSQPQSLNANPDNSQPGESENTEQAGPTDKTGKKKPDAIPFEAFQARLAREKAKHQTLQETLNQKDYEVSRLNKAIEIMASEYEKLKSMAPAMDQRDQKLQEYELQTQAREQFEAVRLAHEQRMQEAQAQAALNEKRAALREQMNDALTTTKGISFDELRQHMLNTHNGDPQTAAKSLYEAKRAAFLSATNGNRVAAPPSIRGNSSNVRPPATHEGMVEYVKTLMAKSI